MTPIFMFVIGACLGSFFNVVLSRKDWYIGRSHCEACGCTIKWFDLIPIVSFLLLRGKCRRCKAKIDCIHLASEVFMGCGFSAVSLCHFNIYYAVTLILTVVFLCLCCISDIREKMVSVLILYSGIITVMLSRISETLINKGIHTAVIYLAVMAAATFIFIMLSKLFKNKVGEGDFDILLILLAATDLYGVLMMVTIASFVGTVIYLPFVLLKKYDRKMPLPLAPLLYIGFIVYILYAGGVI